LFGVAGLLTVYNELLWVKKIITGFYIMLIPSTRLEISFLRDKKIGSDVLPSLANDVFPILSKGFL